MEMFIIYPVFIGMALATAQLAHQKGYPARWWLLLGLLLPVVSMVILFLLKTKPRRTTGYHAPVDRENKDKVLYRKEE